MRFGLDYYANRLALRRYQATERRRARESPSHAFSRVIDLLARHKENMPRGVYSEVRREVVGASDFIRSEEKALDRRLFCWRRWLLPVRLRWPSITNWLERPDC